MRILIVRHGETDANAKRFIQGHSNNPLNSVGISQAEKLAKRLASEKIDHIYTSDLLRARDTGRAVSKVLGLPLNLTDRLRERCYGIFEGRDVADYHRAIETSSCQHHEFKPEGGESFHEVRDRAADFLTLLFSRHVEQSLLLVAHSGINKMLLGCLLGKSVPQATEIDQRNTCLNVIEMSEDGVGNAVLLNCTEHL